MKVAIDISPTLTGHKIRGIGAYTKNLIDVFRKKEWGIEFIFFKNPASPPPADIIHYPYFDLFFHTLPIKKTSSRVVTIHDVIPLVFPNHFPRGPRGSINLFLQKLALRNVDAVICDSKTSKLDIILKLGIPKEKVHVIYLAPSSNFRPISDKKLLSAVTRNYNLPDKFALYVGDVNWHKNILNLLEAIKISKANLVMVGGALVDNSIFQTVEIDRKIKDLKLEDKIIKTGFVEENDLVAIYNLASVTVLPSYYEGFGLPVLEGMACGTPVVCSNVASLTEIADGYAIFCDPRSPYDIAHKIKLIISSSGPQRKLLSQKNQEHAAKFNWDKSATETIKVYKSQLR